MLGAIEREERAQRIAHRRVGADDGEARVLERVTRSAADRAGARHADDARRASLRAGRSPEGAHLAHVAGHRRRLLRSHGVHEAAVDASDAKDASVAPWSRLRPAGRSSHASVALTRGPGSSGRASSLDRHAQRDVFPPVAVAVRGVGVDR